MLEPSPPGGAAYVANPPSGASPLVLVEPPGAQASITWRQDDYAWTHSTLVEGFFVVLTAVVVPVAIMRWTRRLRALLHAAARQRADMRS